MLLLKDLMKESEKLEYHLFQGKMMEASGYFSSLYFKLRTDWVLYRAKRRILREEKAIKNRGN